MPHAVMAAIAIGVLSDEFVRKHNYYLEDLTTIWRLISAVLWHFSYLERRFCAHELGPM